MKQIVIVVVSLWIGSQLFAVNSYADNAEVLPKGVIRADVSTKLYIPWDERYDPDGDVETIAEDYNTALNSGVFSALGLVESAFAMPTGTASLGNSVVSFDYHYSEINVFFGYGLTDKLSVGVLIPYIWQKNKVSAELDASTATVGKSTVGTGLGAPLVPLAGGGPFGDAVPLTTDDVLNLLGGGLDTNGDSAVDIPGFDYKRVETWSDNGIGDIEAGFKYQYLKTENWRLAFLGAVRFPTGDADDPDNLIDVRFGYDAYALLFYFNNDYTGIENLLLDFTFRYDLYLPDKEDLRVQRDVNLPITADREKVDRDLGDLIEFEISGAYTLSKGLTASFLYAYKFSLEDDVDGNEGFAYESLEQESDPTSHDYKIGVTYSTIPLFVEKKFPVPLNAYITYRNRFAGSNNIPKNQYIGFGIQLFLKT